MTKRALYFKGLGTKECLKLVHTNVYKPFCVYIWIVWVFVHFIDKYSSFSYIDRKTDAFDKYIEIKVELDILLGKHIKTLQLDQVMYLVGSIISIWSMR